MHTVFALLCFVVVLHWLIFPYPSGLLHWHCGNLTIAPAPAKQPWWIWMNTSCEFIMNDCITTTKQSTTNPCAYFLGYPVDHPIKEPVTPANDRASYPTDSSTVYHKKYAHGYVVLCFVVVMQSCIMNSHEVFIHIHQGCFAGTGAIVRLPQCQWSKPDGYGKISQCITTTKHSKVKTVYIFLGIYCTAIRLELCSSACCIPMINMSKSHDRFNFNTGTHIPYRLYIWTPGFLPVGFPWNSSSWQRRFVEAQYMLQWRGSSSRGLSHASRTHVKEMEHSVNMLRSESL